MYSYMKTMNSCMIKVNSYMMNMNLYVTNDPDEHELVHDEHEH
jgi:hypothetical protein